MPVNYGILRGKVTDAIPYEGGTDHYQIEITANGQQYRIAVDVYSELANTQKTHYRNGKNNQVLETDRMVMFYQDTDYEHPLTGLMPNAATGFTAKADMDKSLWLDFIRYTPSLFPLDKMTVLPPKNANGSGPDLNDKIDPWVQKAKNNANAEVYAFGSGWNDSSGTAEPDERKYFTASDSLGIHDIHMNQGDSGSEAKNNGAWQDGALFIHFTDISQWVAMFFRFQNQSIDTDNNGNPTGS
jgi:uncharacterized protein YukJ